jgi:ectoine hydroxylase-related dioxygenase (phytanoyl-CoA dioxygenase family)
MIAQNPSIFTDQQVESYKSNGYLLPQIQVFNEDELNELTEIFESLEKAGKNLDTPHFREPALLKFLLSEKVFKVVEPLIGPDFGLFSSHFISKEPGKGKATPWHEDSNYWDGRFDQFNGIVTLWLALDESTEENGCMKLIPGTHLRDDFIYEPCSLEENIFVKEIVNIDENEAVSCVLKRGEFSLHDSRMVHGAQPNRSNKRRCGYTMRYFSQHMKYVVENGPNFKLWHCRGQNPHGNPAVNAS